MLRTGMSPAGTKRSRARVSAVGFLSHASPWKKRSNRLALLGHDWHISVSGCWNTRLNGANLCDSCKGISSFVRKSIVRACLIGFEKGISQSGCRCGGCPHGQLRFSRRSACPVSSSNAGRPCRPQFARPRLSYPRTFPGYGRRQRASASRSLSPESLLRKARGGSVQTRLDSLGSRTG